MIYTEQDRVRRLEEMRKLAVARGGECLSNRFIDNKTKLHWRCAEGHEWEAIPQNVIRGHWCMICGNERQGRLKAHTIEMMQKIAAERGGECLSTIYKNNTTELRWRCKHGHEWTAVPGSVVGRKNFKGSWCPICAGKLPKNSALQELQKLAVRRGGKLLSKHYKNARSHLRWQCAKAHKWSAIPSAVKRGGWCPICAGSFPLNIGHMRKAASTFDGRCLSKKYINVDTPLRWRCLEGHEWSARPENVLAGHWCPICATGISERICRALLERMTGIPFPKARPQWLKNERGRQMELDGYAPSLELAFEYQGHQHFQPVSFFTSNVEKFNQRQQDDERKRCLCLEHGVTLLAIPYSVPHDGLHEYLAKRLNELKRGLVIDSTPVKIGRLGVWRRKNLEEMKLPTAASCGVSAPLPEQRQLSIHRLFCWAALLLNVALDDLLGRAFPHRPDIAPVTPKLSTPKHATNFWMHTKHLPRCDALHHLHNPRRRPTPARPNKHMHMIPVRSHLLDLIPIPLANLPQRLHQGLPILRLPKHLLAGT